MAAARSGTAPPQGENAWVLKLAQSLREELAYDLTTRGRWPAELLGTLFRAGPGLFERNGMRKKIVSDGDGMVRAYDILDGQVSFRSAYVRTTKFREEEALGRFKYATWSTRAPGGILRNLGGGKCRSQANAALSLRHGKILAFDEIGLPWALDPNRLRTISRYQIGGPTDRPAFKTRTKLNPLTGDWTVVGNDYVEPLKVRIVTENAHGKLKSELDVVLPRKTYFRDFFATPHYVVIGMTAVRIKTLRAALGLAPILDSVRWAPEDGNIAFVVPRNGDDPFAIEAPPSWVFHNINAYEMGDEIVADFVGYDSPEWLLGDDPALGAVMEDRINTVSVQGTVRRWRINLKTRTLDEETIHDGAHEYPTIDPLRAGLPYQQAYLATARPGQWWTSGVARIDVDSGNRDTYEAQSTQCLGEPVFVPRQGGGTDEGWLLVEELDGRSGVNSLLLFDAARVSAGPIAEANLQHALPISFQGVWMPLP